WLTKPPSRSTGKPSLNIPTRTPITGSITILRRASMKPRRNWPGGGRLNFSGRTLSDPGRPTLYRFRQPWPAEQRVRIMGKLFLLVVASLLAPQVFAQNADRTQEGPTTVIGPRNPDLQDGAKQLLAGRAKEGVDLTLRGLKVAQGAREEEAALSNLCAGYIMLENYQEALKYCELLIERELGRASGRE